MLLISSSLRAVQFGAPVDALRAPLTANTNDPQRYPMGIYDSSRTRVVPVFNALMDRDPSARTWLLSLLRLGSRSTGRPGIPPGALLLGHPRWWGKNERRLDPPKSLLRWLVAHASTPASEFWGSPATRAKRERLVARDASTILEALRLLNGPTASRAWYVLEGRSQPDACFETDTLIVLIEGKRTESKATTVTTWMSTRSQMLRHMDAAWEIRDGKRVLGLMIVEGPGGAEAVTPTDHWLAQGDRQVLPQTLTHSLPHRSVEEQKEIAGGFLGVTTWQKVCEEFDIAWPPCEDTG